MIINRRITQCLCQRWLRKPTTCQIAKIFNRDRIGNRDWVGFGRNGSACYSDNPAFPFPAIRFKENTNELLALREKEKGDWRKLSIDEKKILYRASFRQTLVECVAPEGKWKLVTGVTLVLVSISLWLSFCVKRFVRDTLPPTFSEEHRAATLRTLLDYKRGIINGLSSKWDYEKDDWK